MRHSRTASVASLAWAAALALCLATVAPNARAGEPRKDDAQARAVTLYDESVVLYRAGDFTAALARLHAAYELSHAAVLLYNMARSYEGLGDLKNAIDAYERYLAGAPDAEDRGAIEQRLTTLRRQLAEQEALRRDRARESAAVPPPTSPPAVARSLSPLPWIVVGIGGAALAAGGALGGLALKDHDDAVAGATAQKAAVSDGDDAKALARAANITFVAGGVVAAAGLAWGLIRLRAGGGGTAVVVTPMLGTARGGGYAGVRIAAF